MEVMLQTYLMMCKLQRLKTTYTKGKLWVSKTSLDLLLPLSTADRYAYNLASPTADDPSSSSYADDSSASASASAWYILPFVQSADPLFICVEIVCAFWGKWGGGGGVGGRGNACLENKPCWTRKRTWFAWRNKHTSWVTSPSPLAFCYLRFLVPTYLASCGPHVMLDSFCIIDSQCLSKDFFLCNLSNVFLGNFVLWPKWQWFTRRFSQIWLQGKYESNEKI